MAESFIHTLADALSTSICAGTRICQFVVVLADAKVGQDCNICSHCLIENDFVIGDRVTVKSGAQLWDGLRVGDDVFIGPNVTFTNGKFPRCKAAPMHYPKTVVNAGASVVVGGGDPAGHYDWRPFHRGRWGHRHPIGVGRCDRDGQYCTHCWERGVRT